MQPEWFEKKKALNELVLTADEKNKLNDIAFVNMVMTRDKDDEKELYNLLGDKDYRKFLDSEFKSEKSNFHISINVDMWITGFDVPCLTMLYNDKPLSKHTLIQTISRVNRKFGTKECGFIIDYIGIREEMKKAMKKYGGEVGPQEDLDVAHEVLTVFSGIMTLPDFSSFRKRLNISLPTVLNGKVRFLSSNFSRNMLNACVLLIISVTLPVF